MAFLIELSTQKGDNDSNEMNTEEIPEKSSDLCQDAPNTEDLQETPADNDHK